MGPAKPYPEGPNQNHAGDTPSEAQVNPNSLVPSPRKDAKQEHPKALHPHLSAGRSALRRFPKLTNRRRRANRATAAVDGRYLETSVRAVKHFFE